MSRERVELEGRRVLVTGATGFIGGRVVEKLFRERRARVRVLVRDLPRAVRIARFPVELAHGDVADPVAVTEAARDCDVVIHCAYGSRGDAEERRRVNVDGTRNVLEAALEGRVRRVVHLSTVMVYGLDTPAVLDERAPRSYSGDAYGDAKLDAEALAFQYRDEHGLPVTVLQPTAVYGPFGVQWTERVLAQLGTARMPLIDGGEGILNTVYIDDVADAVLLAAQRPEAVGEAFLVTGQAVTYREFYARFEEMLGAVRTVSLSQAEAVARWSEARDGGSAAARPANSEAAERIMLIDPVWITYRARRSVVSSDKARRLLGFRPRLDFDTGMRLTEQWARWANLIPPLEGS